MAEEELSDKDLAPKQNTWDDELPRLTEEDLGKCMVIVEELMGRFQKRAVKDLAGFWEEVSQRSKHRFAAIGIEAHVEIVIVSRNVITKQQKGLRLATEKNPIGYAIIDGDFMIPDNWEAEAISPVIVVDDFDDINKKKEHAEQSIIEREARRSRGDSYFPDGINNGS